MCIQDSDKHFLKNVWIVVVNRTLFLLNKWSLLSFMLSISLCNLQEDVYMKEVKQGIFLVRKFIDS